MVYKTISLSESIYNQLIKYKSKKESFDETIKRLLEKQQPSLLTFAGRWKDVDVEHLKTEIKRQRDESDERLNDSLP